MEELATLFSKRMTAPPKGNSGNRVTLTADQEWYLWSLYDHCTQRELSSDLHIGKDKVKEHHDRLAAQGGPKGAKPAWVK